MMKKLHSTVAMLAGLVCMMLSASVAAQNYDPPGRVARIRYIQGSVSFAPAGESEWIAAVTNRPVTIGDQLWVDADSRAELDAGSAVIRVNANTSISFLNLDDRTLQVQLTQGVINLRVRRLHSGDIVEVDTPNQAFSVVAPGLYRVDAGADGSSSVVVVRQGHGQVTGGGQSYDLYSGQSGRFDGTGTDSLNGQLVSVNSADDFDRWGESRDSQYERSQSARYVSPDVVGYEDLDGNGVWQSNPTYGNVWVPTGVQQGWAPYRNGHWVWISPWGWTWVDDEPWGYAPFHYGRWVNVGNQWGWVPGPQNVQPVYAPALVAFIGGVSAGGGGGYPAGGNVGWFPLAPQDPYVPSYYASRGYVQRVNTSNTVVRTTNITNVYNNQATNNITYVNRTVPGAVTVVPPNVVQSSAPVAKAVVPMDAKRIAAAPVATKPSVAPTQASVLGTTNTTANRMAHPPAAVATRSVIAKTTPPPPPVPFAKQQQELAKQLGKPLPPQTVQTLRPSRAAEVHPAVKLAPPSKPATLVASQPNAEVAKPGNVPAQQQQAQQQAAQQQAEKVRQQQAQQQVTQQQAAQQQAEKAHQQQAQQQAAQQQAVKAREQQAQQQPAQQQAEKAREQQAQQQAAPQPAEKARQQQSQQQAAQQPAEKAREQQAQQQATPQPAEKARQQQSQQQAAQQPAEKAREQQAQQQAAQPQARQQAPPQQAQPPASARPAEPPQKQSNNPQAQPTRPPTPDEKAREEKKKREEQTPRPPQ